MADGSNKRKYKRLPSSMSACVRKVKVSPHDLDEIRLVIKNISMGGMCIETPQHLTHDGIYQIKIGSGGHNGKVTPSVMVAWSTLTPRCIFPIRGIRL